jgi:hypothetical protein
MSQTPFIVLLLLLGFSSCAIDDRPLQVNGACTSASPGGLITDFSAARQGVCSAQNCPADLVESPTVSLGVADILGLVFPYRSPGLAAVLLTPGPTGGVDAAASEQALRVVMNSRAAAGTSPGYDGFALQFLSCVDASNAVGVAFMVAGDLGICPLRAVAQLKEADAGTFQTPCPFDQCFASLAVPVALGATTVTIVKQRGGQTALAGVQWEFSVPTGQSGGCKADFTIDDVRLVPGP